VRKFYFGGLWCRRHDTLAVIAATTSGVIARLDRAIQYAEAAVIEPRGRGVLDSPPTRGM